MRVLESFRNLKPQKNIEPDTFQQGNLNSFRSFLYWYRLNISIFKQNKINKNIYMIYSNFHRFLSVYNISENRTSNSTISERILQNRPIYDFIGANYYVTADNASDLIKIINYGGGSGGNISLSQPSFVPEDIITFDNFFVISQSSGVNSDRYIVLYEFDEVNNVINECDRYFNLLNGRCRLSLSPNQDYFVTSSVDTIHTLRYFKIDKINKKINFVNSIDTSIIGRTVHIVKGDITIVTGNNGGSTTSFDYSLYKFNINNHTITLLENNIINLPPPNHINSLNNFITMGGNHKLSTYTLSENKLIFNSSITNTWIANSIYLCNNFILTTGTSAVPGSSTARRLDRIWVLSTGATTNKGLITIIGRLQ